MKNTARVGLLLAITCLPLFILAQGTRAFNQNASRSNHTRSAALSDPWSFGLNAGASFATKSSEASLFRGNNMATKFFANYSFDRFGIGISSGIIPGSINNAELNRFITEQKFQGDLQTNSSKPFNSYLLAGPSFQFGQRVGITASLQGGMFFNDPGSVSIRQQTAANSRTVYAFQDAGQKLFPGFAGSIHIRYPINRHTQFLVNADYLQSRSSIQLVDVNNGIDIPAQQNRNLQLITTGIGIVRTFGGNNNNSKRTRAFADAGDLATPPFHKSDDNHSCGTVTQRTTKPDGSVEELVFACPDDALAYAKRMAQDHNSSRSNKSASVADHNSSRSNKSSSVVSPENTGGDDQQKVQDHNSSRSNKSSSVAMPDTTGGDGPQKAQDHNSSRSNKSASAIAVDADLDGDGKYETDITSKVSDLIHINEKGEIEVPQQRAGVSTSRSGIIRTRSSLQPAGNDLYVCHGTAEVDHKIVPVRIIYK